MRPSPHGNGAAPPRAWLDDAHAAWDREARSYGPDDDEDEDADPDDTPVVPVNPYEPDSDGGECDRRAWLTYRQHEAWESLSDLYPHAELVAGPAVRVGGLTGGEYRRDVAGVLWADVPLGLPVWESAMHTPGYVVVDLKPLEG